MNLRCRHQWNIAEQEELPLVTPIKDEKPKKDFAMDAGEDMEDVLTCVCCQDIMTNPITLEPCLHAFCDECYTSWEAIQRSWCVFKSIVRLFS